MLLGSQQASRRFDFSLSPRLKCPDVGGARQPMGVKPEPKSEPAQVLALNRRLRDLRAIASKLKGTRMTPLQVCEAIIEKRVANRAVRAFFSGLPKDERHYWTSSLYALMMSKARR